MKKCRICGFENSDGAESCAECGIRFAPLTHTQPKSLAHNGSRRKALSATIILLALVLGVVAVGVRMVSSMDRRPNEKPAKPFVLEANSARNNPPEETPLQKEPTVSAIRVQEKSDRFVPVEEKEPDLNIDVGVEELTNIVMKCPPYDLGLEFSDLSSFNVSWERFLQDHPGIFYYDGGAGRKVLSSSGVLFFGRNVSEITLVFTSECLVTLEVSVFNKGTEGTYAEISSARGVIADVKSNIWSRKVEENLLQDGNMSVTHYTWVGSSPKVRASLGVYNDNGDEMVEFLNFKMSIRELDEVLKVKKPIQNVRRSGNDVYIENIPMVDQGQKGYCVPATIGRLLRYYGINADMHNLAMVMETACGGGTCVGGDFPTLTKIANDADMTRTDYKNIEVYDEAFFERYNAAARASKAEELHIEDYTVDEEVDGETVRMHHWDWMSDAMDKEIARQSRNYDSEGFERFQNGIISCINNGNPLIWSVDRLFPWDTESGRLGSDHMRLIVGYNRRSCEVIYSDSWGSEREYKRAPMSAAWEVTNFMSCLAP